MTKGRSAGPRGRHDLSIDVLEPAGGGRPRVLGLDVGSGGPAHLDSHQIVMGIMVLVIVAMLAFFKWKKWI